MDIFAIDLQRISLGALVIALGLLVDDAMIAVEMMVKKLEEGFDKFRAATFAYTSTAFPMLTGTLVSVAGFPASGFCQERSGGILLFTLFAVVTIALLVSWIVAVIFTPYIGTALLKEQPGAAAAWRPRRGGRAHDAMVPWRAHRRASTAAQLVIGGTVAAFVIALGLFGLIENQFFPASNRPELLIDLRLAQNASDQGHGAGSGATGEIPEGRSGRALSHVLCGLGRGAFLPASQRAARKREFRAGGCRDAQL